MTGKRKALLIPAILFAALLALFALRVAFFLAIAVAPPEPRIIAVSPGTPLAGVALELQEEGVVSNARLFTLFARLRGGAGRVKAGEYEFAAAARPNEVLGRLVAGDVRRVRFTIPEGLTLAQVAARLEEQGLGEAKAFLAAARDPALVAPIAPKALTLEGYLFPETYMVETATTPSQLVASMVSEFRRRLDPRWVASAQKLGLDLHQLVTLASIVQAEAGNDEEMPLIAGVFHNRLRIGIPLQADPTVIYGIEGFDGNLTRVHLETKTPYNTYRFAGLPRGPICNPGEEALRAAAQPARVDYLYFVATGEGTHVFSKTLEEHNRAVRRYQLKR